MATGIMVPLNFSALRFGAKTSWTVATLAGKHMEWRASVERAVAYVAFSYNVYGKKSFLSKESDTL